MVVIAIGLPSLFGVVVVTGNVDVVIRAMDMAVVLIVVVFILVLLLLLVLALLLLLLLWFCG